jgi:hypothetical protein
MATKKLKSNSAVKPTVKKRTVNRPGAAQPHGAPANEQDVKRRLGNFTTAGEHARIGGRTSGIVGQTTKKGRTDNRKK